MEFEFHMMCNRMRSGIPYLREKEICVGMRIKPISTFVLGSRDISVSLNSRQIWIVHSVSTDIYGKKVYQVKRGNVIVSLLLHDLDEWFVEVSK